MGLPIEGETHEEVAMAPLAPQTRQPPSYLKDYYCHAASKDPVCMLPIQPSPSGKVYPITNYVSYDHFYHRRQAYLVAITNQKEPRSYMEAM